MDFVQTHIVLHLILLWIYTSQQLCLLQCFTILCEKQSHLWKTEETIKNLLVSVSVCNTLLYIIVISLNKTQNIGNIIVVYKPVIRDEKMLKYTMKFIFCSLYLKVSIIRLCWHPQRQLVNQPIVWSLSGPKEEAASGCWKTLPYKHRHHNGHPNWKWASCIWTVSE